MVEVDPSQIDDFQEQVVEEQQTVELVVEQVVVEADLSQIDNSVVEEQQTVELVVE
jgi:hypothetical protein